MSLDIRRTLMAGAAVVVAISLVFGSVAASDEPEASPGDAEPTDGMATALEVTDAWTRESPMMELAGAAYMTIHNGTDADDALVGASSPAAAVVELHLSAMDEEGMMAMAQVPEIPIPAHAEAVLEPGGYHIMLIGLVEPLAEGDEVELSLEFRSAEPQTIVAPVLSGVPMDMGADGMEGMADDMDAMTDDGTDEDGSHEEEADPEG